MTATCADTSPLDAGKFAWVNDVAFKFRFGVATLREIRARARLASAICARQASEDKKEAVSGCESRKARCNVLEFEHGYARCKILPRAFVHIHICEPARIFERAGIRKRVYNLVVCRKRISSDATCDVFFYVIFNLFLI